MAPYMQKFEGEWQEYKTENFDAFLDATGVGTIKKAVFTKIHPKFTFSVDGNTINVKASAGPIDKKSSFNLGEEFDAGMEVEGTAIASFDDSTGKLTVNVTPKDPKINKITVVRDVVDGELKQVMTTGSVTCTRYFKRK